VSRVFRLNIRRAMRAFGGFQRNLRDAARAIAFADRLAHKTVSLFDNQKDDEGDNEEIDDRVDEQSVIDCRSPGGFGGGERIVMFVRQADEQAREIHLAEQQADRRHDDIADERRNDLAECRADDDADRQIDNIAACGEITKFLEEVHRFLLAAGIKPQAISPCKRRPRDQVFMSFRQVFRHRDFALMWSQRFLANIALMIQSVTIGWQIYTIARQTYNIEQSSFLVGMIGLAQFAPFFICSLFAGEMADRYDRRMVLMAGIGGQIFCTAVFAWLAWMPHPPLVVLFLMAALLHLLRAFIMPASMSLVPMLVPADILPKAVAWSSLGGLSGRIIGPWIGGTLCALSLFSSYMAAIIAFVAAWACAFLIRTNTKPVARKTEESSLGLIGEGLAYVWSNKILFGAISLDLLAVFLGGATALLPVYARDILQVGPQGFGLLRSASAIGGIVTLGILAFRPIRRHAGLWMFASVTIFGAATLVFGVSDHLLLSMVMLAVLGAADSVSVYIRQTLVQIVTPDRFRGRVSAVASMFISASNELGEFESGVAARFLGPVGAVLFGGIGSIIVSGLWARLFPALRKADRLEAPKL